ncbi:MAG: macro domain-containing protein [Actinobacteria bacterium]|nr:macro domain-containing protein [Actinomycetota bacterium]
MGIIRPIKKIPMTTKYKIGNSILELFNGDITVYGTEAIANAANRRLSPGGGVSGAIHRAAGPQLWEECKKLGGCNTGEAKLTSGYNLKAKYVIHTVGPVYSSSISDPEDLKDCYKNCLLLASRNKIKSISFPSISTGIFGYPIKDASMIALKTIINFLKEHVEIELVRMVLFSNGDYNIYKSSLENILKD